MKLKKHIIPAMIAKTQEELTKNIEKTISYVDRIQLDIMDNIFVPNTSLFFDFKLPNTPCHYEAHLMVKDPMHWIKNNIEKVQTILVHFESDFDIQKIISYVKKQNKKIGFALNPETKIDVLFDILEDIDQVLIMTVKPGFYGSSFIPEMKDKILKLRELSPSLNIEVDGGVTPETISIVDDAGANLFVSGSYIVKANKPSKSIEILKNMISN